MRQINSLLIVQLSFNNDIGVFLSSNLAFNDIELNSSTIYTLSGDDDITFDVNNEYAHANYYTGSGDDVVRIINEITTYGTIIRKC